MNEFNFASIKTICEIILEITNHSANFKLQSNDYGLIIIIMNAASFEPEN